SAREREQAADAMCPQAPSDEPPAVKGRGLLNALGRHAPATLPVHGRFQPPQAGRDSTAAMPGTGFEPAGPCGRRILSPLTLPVCLPGPRDASAPAERNLAVGTVSWVLKGRSGSAV